MIDFKIRTGDVLQISPHSDRRGFSAVVSSIFAPMAHYSWNEVGHGYTIEEAIEQAKTKANGQAPKPIYKMEDFDETNNTVDDSGKCDDGCSC